MKTKRKLIRWTWESHELESLFGRRKVLIALELLYLSIDRGERRRRSAADWLFIPCNFYSLYTDPPPLAHQNLRPLIRLFLAIYSREKFFYSFSFIPTSCADYQVPNKFICINKHIKKSHLKYRENLFQNGQIYHSCRPCFGIRFRKGEKIKTYSEFKSLPCLQQIVLSPFKAVCTAQGQINFWGTVENYTCFNIW